MRETINHQSADPKHQAENRQSEAALRLDLFHALRLGDSSINGHGLHCITVVQRWKIPQPRLGSHRLAWFFGINSVGRIEDSEILVGRALGPGREGRLRRSGAGRSAVTSHIFDWPVSSYAEPRDEATRY